MNKRSSEYGITPTVRTFFSGYTTAGIIRNISGRKRDAVLCWMNMNYLCPEKILIIGGYLTGVSLAESLSKDSEVAVLDIHPEIRTILDPSVSFLSGIDEAKSERYDMIIDTTGFGGIAPDDFLRLKRPEIFLIEDPCSEGSDECLRRISRTEYLLQKAGAARKGILQTGGLNSKTSGTMTLTIEVLRNSMNDAMIRDGVLYSTANMDFFERILFREKDPGRFLKCLDKSAMAVSSLKDIDCDEIIDRNMERLESIVLDHTG